MENSHDETRRNLTALAVGGCQAAQHVTDYGRSDIPANIIDGEDEPHDAACEHVRSQTDLTANHVQAARS